jgi:hypothetical protein
MTLKELGYTDVIDTYLKVNRLAEFAVGRVTQEHRERYFVSTGEEDYDAEITGKGKNILCGWFFRSWKINVD